MRRLGVIVADDDPAMREWLRHVLTGPAISVGQATGGAELLLLLATMRHVDLVISDVCMPLLNGLDALATVRMAGIDVPFLLITAFGDRDLRCAAEKLNACVLDKPISARELLDRVAALMTGLQVGSRRPS